MTDGGDDTVDESDGGHRHALPDVEMLEPSEVEEKLSSVDDPGSLNVLLDDERLCENRSEVIAAIEDRLAAVRSDESDNDPEVRADGGRSLVDVTWEDEMLLRLTHSGDTHVFVMGLYRHKGERIYGVELDNPISFVRPKARRWVEEGVVEDYVQQSDDATTVPISEGPDTIENWVEKYRDVGHPFDDYYVFVRHRDDGRYKDELAVETGKSPSDARTGRHPEDADAGEPAQYYAGTVREVFENGGGRLPFTPDVKKSQTVGYQRGDMTALLKDGLVSPLKTALEGDGVGPDAIVGDDVGEDHDDPEIRADGGVESPFPATGTIVTDASAGGELEMTFVADHPDGELLPKLDEYNVPDSSARQTVDCDQLIGLLGALDRQCIWIATADGDSGLLIGTGDICEGDCRTLECPPCNKSLSSRASGGLTAAKKIHVDFCHWTRVHRKQLLAAARECSRGELHLQLTGKRNHAICGNPHDRWWCLPVYESGRVPKLRDPDDADSIDRGDRVETDGGVDSPFPATGTVVPEKTGHRASFDCATEYFSEADEDYLYRAVAAAAKEHGVGKEVRVRFTGSKWTCNGFELLGPVDETPDDVQRLEKARQTLDTSRWPSLTPEQTDRIEDAFDAIDSVAREVQTEDESDNIDREGSDTGGF